MKLSILLVRISSPLIIRIHVFIQIGCLVLFTCPCLVNSAAVSPDGLSTDNATELEQTTEVPVTTTTTTLAVRKKKDEQIDRSTPIVDDVIELNIGGQKMTTLRSTLTVVGGSKLAQMFKDKPSVKKLPIDKDGAVFFDYNPIYFNFLLDQLRAIKQMPKKPAYQLQFQAPYVSSQMNFTYMLSDLGLTGQWVLTARTYLSAIFILANDFLFPTEGTHINLTVDSLAGWQECYRSSYDVPFNLSILTTACNGSRLLVACRSTQNKKLLTLAGIGEQEDVLHPCLPKQCQTNGKSKKKNKKLTCSSSSQCMTQAKRGVGWYNANNQTWGFVRGSLSFVVNPCDSSNLDTDYRLCWTGQTSNKQDHGDRCGSAKNLQDSTQWERLIYSIV